jgi:hypothetical protein
MKKTLFISIALLLSLIVFGQDEGTNVELRNISNCMLYLWCLAGCILQEFIYWFELRYEIAKGNIPSVLKSSVYWIITLLAIAIFSSCSYLYFLYGEQEVPNFFTTAVFSAGFARIFKGAVTSLGQPQVQPQEQARIHSRSFSLKDYLMIN